VKLAVRNNV